MSGQSDKGTDKGTGFMQVKEIHAKSILNRMNHPSSWFGVEYNMNVYRGCQHSCIYCDSRSECYRIENFDDIIVKVNAPKLLENELRRKRKRGTIGTGAMSDPYIPLEKKYNLTGKCLEIIEKYRFPLMIGTKSNLILRDIDVLEAINKVYCCVAITITTADDNLAAVLEPNAPSPTQRLNAMGVLSELGIKTGVLMMPVLPYIEDNEENIVDIVNKSKGYGVSFIIPSFGLTLRDRQRDYYYKKLDKHFPGLSDKYKKRYKSYYSCSSPNSKKLYKVFINKCKALGIETKMPSWHNEITNKQLSFFDLD